MTFSQDSIAGKIQNMVQNADIFDDVVILLDPASHLMYLLDTVEHFMTLHRPKRVVLNFSSIASFYVARLLTTQGLEVFALRHEQVLIPHDEGSDEYQAISDILESNPELFNVVDYPVANLEDFAPATVIVPANESFSVENGDLVVDMSLSQKLEDMVEKTGLDPVFIVGPAVENERRMNMEQRPIRPIIIL